MRLGSRIDGGYADISNTWEESPRDLQGSWVKTGRPKWLATWSQGRTPVVFWWLSFDPYPNGHRCSTWLCRQVGVGQNPDPPFLGDSPFCLARFERESRGSGGSQGKLQVEALVPFTCWCHFGTTFFEPQPYPWVCLQMVEVRRKANLEPTIWRYHILVFPQVY